MLEPLHWLLDVLVDQFGKIPGSYGWEFGTAVFGWLACASLILSFVFLFFGFHWLSGFAMSAFSAFLWKAIRRDYEAWKARQPGARPPETA